jgi:hypothetical protein
MDEGYNMDQFFNWLTKPMTYEEIDAWYKANNIIPEMSDLFRDFCVSLLQLVQKTYLGDTPEDIKETKIGLTQEDKDAHFNWCWKTNIKNFEKENIRFSNSKDTYEYFKTFYMDVYYNQQQDEVKKSLDVFFGLLFTRKNKHSKSDIEMFTEIYKLLEKSLIL